MGKLKTFFKLYFGSLIPTKVKNNFLGFSVGKTILFAIIVSTLNTIILMLGFVIAFYIFSPNLKGYFEKVVRSTAEYTKVVIEKMNFTTLEVGVVQDYWDADLKPKPYYIGVKASIFDSTCLENKSAFERCVINTNRGLELRNPELKTDKEISQLEKYDIFSVILAPNKSGKYLPDLEKQALESTLGAAFIVSRDSLVVLSYDNRSRSLEQGNIAPLVDTSYRVTRAELFDGVKKEGSLQLPQQIDADKLDKVKELSGQQDITVKIKKSSLYPMIDMWAQKVLSEYPKIVGVLSTIAVVSGSVLAVVIGIFGAIPLLIKIVVVGIMLSLLSAVVFRGTSTDFSDNLKLSIPIVVGVSLLGVLVQSLIVILAAFQVVGLKEAFDIFAITGGAFGFYLLALAYAVYLKHTISQELASGKQ